MAASGVIYSQTTSAIPTRTALILAAPVFIGGLVTLLPLRSRVVEIGFDRSRNLRAGCWRIAYDGANICCSRHV